MMFTDFYSRMQRRFLFSSSSVGYSVLHEKVTACIQPNEHEDPKRRTAHTEMLTVQMMKEHENENISSFTKIKDTIYFYCVRKLGYFLAMLPIVLLLWILASYAI